MPDLRNWALIYILDSYRQLQIKASVVWKLGFGYTSDNLKWNVKDLVFEPALSVGGRSGMQTYS